MKIARIVKASDDKYVKMESVPDEVMFFFKKLTKKYKQCSFIVDTSPETYQNGAKGDIEIMVYDDYVE
jgi:hypothetical protein